MLVHYEYYRSYFNIYFNMTLIFFELLPTVKTRESTVVTVDDSYNVRINSYNCRRQLQRAIRQL